MEGSSNPHQKSVLKFWIATYIACKYRELNISINAGMYAVPSSTLNISKIRNYRFISMKLLKTTCL